MQDLDYDWLDDRVNFLIDANIADKVTQDVRLSLVPQEDFTPFQRDQFAWYVHTEAPDLSDMFTLLLEAEVDDYGYPDGEVLRRLDDQRKPGYFDVRLQSFTARPATAHLIGRLYGNQHDIDPLDRVVARLSLVGIRKNKKLGFSRRALVEALQIEMHGDFRTAFFLIFTLVDKMVSDAFKNFLATLPKEVQDKALYLELGNKFAVAAKQQGVDPGKHALWSPAKTLFDKLNKKRNTVAHALESSKFRREDVTHALWLYLAVEAILSGTAASAKELRRLYRAKAKAAARRNSNNKSRRRRQV